MGSLYEINVEIENALSAMLDSVNEETGEVDEAAVARLEELECARSDKLDNIGAFIKNLMAEVAALKAEAKSLAERAKAKENEIERLKVYVAQSLIARGEKSFETTRARFSFRRSEAVEIDGDVPDSFMNIKITREPNKTAIKEAIANGEVVEGAHVVVRQNLQIK